MPATVTLTTTTLDRSCDARQKIIKLTSTADVLPGRFLYLDGELVRVQRIDVDPWVVVERGADGTTAIPHESAVTVYVGTGDQFYRTNPTGRPTNAILVSPWINVRNGSIWFAQGDPVGERWWQQQATTYDVGALGVRTKALDPTSST